MTKAECSSEEVAACVLNCKGKVKCTVVQALKFCTGPTAHSESRIIALAFRDH